MRTAVRLHAPSRTSCGLTLIALLVGCGDDSAPPVDAGTVSVDGAATDAPLGGAWPVAATVSTCKDFDNVNVGNYTIQSNYWHKALCPGEQCMDINQQTGAFVVTQGPDPCGDNVATYPNVLYGCAFGICSPGTMLPQPVSAITSVSSSWAFDVQTTATDRYNVSYDMWFCPDSNCGASGFAGGTEVMIWLDYKNVHGWQKKLATVALAGHTWDVWQATMGEGTQAWTYLAYLITSPMVSSVTDLDLRAFVQDGVSRGFIQPSSYLFAIQAGTELRTGGVPFTNRSFSVSINGVTPSTQPITKTPAGPACDGGMPTAEGNLVVSNGYVTAGQLHGYGSAWGWVGGGSMATVCTTPTCTAPGSLEVTATMGNGVAPMTAQAITCSPAFAPSSLCAAGTVTADPSYNQLAGVGFNLNQGPAVAPSERVDGGAEIDAATELDGGADLDGGAGAATIDGGTTVGTITIPKSLTVSVSRTGALAGNAALRVQITGTDNTHYCYFGRLDSGTPIPIEKFNSKCWDNSGKYATPTTPIKRTDVLVPGSASSDLPFAFCLTNVTVE